MYALQEPRCVRHAEPRADVFGGSAACAPYELAPRAFRVRTPKAIGSHADELAPVTST